MTSLSRQNEQRLSGQQPATIPTSPRGALQTRCSAIIARRRML